LKGQSLPGYFEVVVNEILGGCPMTDSQVLAPAGKETTALPWDWPVRRAAFEALLRRLASARGQELAVLDGPRRGALGAYTLASLQSEAPLPYDVRLFSLEPIDARCDCADFLRGSLGLCKHVLAVLDRLAKKPREWQAALAVPPAPLPALVWDARRIPAGPFDPLSALRLTSPVPGLQHYFRSGKDGGLRVAANPEV
jgi:hypothetical protein